MGSLILDSSKRRYNASGHLIAPARVARAGVMDYSLAELRASGIRGVFDDLSSDSVVRLYRDPSMLFADSTLRDVERKPVTFEHPAGGVTDDNKADLQVGTSLTGARQDGRYLAVELQVQDKRTIAAIESGISEISLGQGADIEWTTGVDDQDGPYDGVITNISINHIAIVPAGRAGPEVKIADGGTSMTTRLIDGISVEMPDQAGQFFDKKQAELEGANDKADKLEDSLKALTDERDKLAGELAAAKDQVAKMDDTARLDDMLAERIALVDAAKKLFTDIDPAGKTSREIKVETIKHVIADADLDEKSDAYVDGMFDSLPAQKPAATMDKVLADKATAAPAKSKPSPRDEFIRRNAELHDTFVRGGK